MKPKLHTHSQCRLSFHPEEVPGT